MKKLADDGEAMVIFTRVMTALALLGWLQAAAAAPTAERWIGAWGYAPVQRPPGTPPTIAPPRPAPPPNAVRRTPPPDMPRTAVEIVPGPQVPALADVTIRQLVRITADARRIRLRFTNENGASPMDLGSVHVAMAGDDGAIVPTTDRVVTFNGKQGVRIPSSAPMISDPVNLPAKALTRLLISIQVPGEMPKLGHSLWQYVAGTPGDQTAAVRLPGVRMMRIPALVSQVEVEPVAARSVIVAFGDSITEGALSTPNAFRGWPDRLAERLLADRAGRSWAVVNAGIGGNRVLRYGTGPSILARFDRDVLGVPGVKAVLIVEGINDIGNAFSNGAPPEGEDQPVTADRIVDAYRQFVTRAHAHGIKVIGGTLTPYQGAFYYDPRGDAIRKDVNRRILAGGIFDGIVDFSTATADKANPDKFLAAYNDFDNLHPNDAGYDAMAMAIDLKLITKP